jgi:hypothetical protein
VDAYAFPHRDQRASAYGHVTYPDALGDLGQLLLIDQVRLVEDQAVRERNLPVACIRLSRKSDLRRA